MKRINNQIELRLSQEKDTGFDHFEYSNLETPSSPSDNLMKTKLHNLYSNLSYFDQEGKKIIKKTLQKTPNTQFINHSKPLYFKHSAVLSRTKLKPENKLKDHSLPTLHFSEIKLSKPSNHLLFFDSRQFYPNKSLSKNQIQPQLGEFNQYQRLIKILKHHDKSVSPSPSNLLKDNSKSQKRSRDSECMRSTSMFFKTKRSRYDIPRLQKLKKNKG